MKTFLAILTASTGLIFAQDTEVHVWPAQGDIYMIVGAGGNITVQAGKDGVLVVDTGLADMSDKVLAAIKTISTGPIRSGSPLPINRTMSWRKSSSCARLPKAFNSFRLSFTCAWNCGISGWVAYGATSEDIRYIDMSFAAR